MVPKSNKKHIKFDVLKKHVLEPDFYRCCIVLASPKPPKIELFLQRFGKRRFRKNHAPVEAKSIFSRFRTSKNPTKIDAKTHSKKTSQKGGSNIDFCEGFRLQKPSKSLPKATQNEAGSATLWKPRGSRRKSTGPGVCTVSKWLGI